MALPPTTPERIIAAMELFDREERANNAWEQNALYRYALVYNNQRYPIKKIVSLATDTPLSDFISTEAQRVLKQHNFDIEPLSNYGINVPPLLVDKQSDLIYEAFDHIHQQIFEHDGSLFTPNQPIWTPTIIQDFYQRFVEQANLNDSKFIVKLKQQLNQAPSTTIQLAAELFYIHVLPASRQGMLGKNKRDLINQVLSWMEQPISIPTQLDQALEDGLMTLGQAFNIFRYDYMVFLLTTIKTWKALSPDQRQTLLTDPWAFKQWLFSQPMERSSAQREVLLHMLFPTYFEAIASNNDKNKIARIFSKNQNYSDVDRQLYLIRQQLSPIYGQQFHFYQPRLAKQWREGMLVEQVIELPFETFDYKLSAYTRLASNLGNASYSAEQIVQRVGQMSPPLVSSEPAADSLVHELRLLRIIKATDDGRYQRWEHLSDGTEYLLKRYIALTLLVPIQAQNDQYELPILRLPTTSEPQPITAWPYQSQLWRWYEEAGLVKAIDDQHWQVEPNAFQSIAQNTPTAQAINLFLSQLETVRQQSTATPLLASTLPILEPELLNERVREIQAELLIEEGVIKRIYSALIAGRHVILSGPPGTGKTHLARLLPSILWRDEIVGEPILGTDPTQSPLEPPFQPTLLRHGYAVQVVTATEDWTTRHVIGGIVPQLYERGDQRQLVYGIRHGYLTQAVLANYQGYAGETIMAQFERSALFEHERHYRGRWLVIDEFTRAPIDAAFGSLLTTLGGQQNPTLAVPTNQGSEQLIPLPADFRLIGTLNSFDRHFLNQLSEAMKRRFTFIDILPPSRQFAATEQGLALFKALQNLARQEVNGILQDEQTIHLINQFKVSYDPQAELAAAYQVELLDSNAQALHDFWRIFQAIRIYRQLGTAQAEAVYTTMIAMQTVGMEWSQALDAALADVLADQLQVLNKDEQRVILAFIQAADKPTELSQSINQLLKELPKPRRLQQLSQFNRLNPAIQVSEQADVKPEHLGDIFNFANAITLSPASIFIQRLQSFIHERGL